MTTALACADKRGTPTGYRRHHHRGQKPCDACSEARAHAQYEQRHPPSDTRRWPILAPVDHTALHRAAAYALAAGELTPTTVRLITGTSPLHAMRIGCELHRLGVVTAEIHGRRRTHRLPPDLLPRLLTHARTY